MILTIMNYRKNIFIISSLLGVLLFACANAYSAKLTKLIIFHSPSCHKCLEVKKEIIPQIEKEFIGRIEIEYRDINELESYKLLLSLREKYKNNIEIVLPVFYFEGGYFLNAKGEIKNSLKQLIDKSQATPRENGKLPSVDLISYFKKITPLAIISAGLIDGINPCAFTVIVFFISFLALQGYRKRELLVIGLSFISAVFLTYLLLGLGIFNFLYRLKAFWFITKALNISIGIFSIILGILAIYDLFTFKKTQSTEGLILQLPKSIKNRIHYVIGLHYRKGEQRHALRLFITALLTGFLVSLLEAVCTGQTYLPTIGFILKTTPLKLEALAYLLVYNLMFILPLLIIFFLCLLGVTSQQFAGFLKRHLVLVKLLMGILFFSLGIFLVWRA